MPSTHHAYTICKGVHRTQPFRLREGRLRDRDDYPARPPEATGIEPRENIRIARQYMRKTLRFSRHSGVSGQPAQPHEPRLAKARSMPRTRCSNIVAPIHHRPGRLEDASMELTRHPSARSATRPVPSPSARLRPMPPNGTKRAPRRHRARCSAKDGRGRSDGRLRRSTTMAAPGPISSPTSWRWRSSRPPMAASPMSWRRTNSPVAAALQQHGSDWQKENYLTTALLGRVDRLLSI